LGLAPKPIIINLSPAGLPNEGSHFYLPVALALLTAMGVPDAEQVGDFRAVGPTGAGQAGHPLARRAADGDPRQRVGEGKLSTFSKNRRGAETLSEQVPSQSSVSNAKAN
jgi:hypothetical protein